VGEDKKIKKKKVPFNEATAQEEVMGSYQGKKEESEENQGKGVVNNEGW